MLTGCRILVTARRRAHDMGAALTHRGAEVTQVATLGVVPHVDDPALVSRTRELLARGADVLVVTTGTGLRGWLAAADAAGLGPRLVETLAGLRIVARGPKASAALREAGLRGDWVAESETCAELTDFLLAEGVAGKRIVLQHHGAHDPVMEKALLGAGAETVNLEIYRWGCPEDPAAVARAAQDLSAGRYDAAVFTSAPGAVAWLSSLAGSGATDEVRSRVSRGELLLAAVGPVTAEPLAYAGMVASVPARARLGALVRLVITELGDDRHALRTLQGRLRVRAGSVTLDHRPVQLSPSGLAVMRRLAMTPGHVVTRDELLQVLPGESRDPHTAEVAVARLRESLRGATGDSRLVRTVVKRGYVLAAG